MTEGPYFAGAAFTLADVAMLYPLQSLTSSLPKGNYSPLTLLPRRSLNLALRFLPKYSGLGQTIRGPIGISSGGKEGRGELPYSIRHNFLIVRQSLDFGAFRPKSKL